MKSSRALYQIRADVLVLCNRLLDADPADAAADGEITAELAAFMADLEHEQGAKCDSYIGAMRMLRARAAAAKVERDEWTTRERVATAAADRLDATLREYMGATGQPKIVTEEGRTLSLVKNGGIVGVDIDKVNPASVSTDYTREVVELDKDAIRAALEQGKGLDFARFKPRGNHLRIS